MAQVWLGMVGLLIAAASLSGCSDDDSGGSPGNPTGPGGGGYPTGGSPMLPEGFSQDADCTTTEDFVTGDMRSATINCDDTSTGDHETSVDSCSGMDASVLGSHELSAGSVELTVTSGGSEVWSSTIRGSDDDGARFWSDELPAGSSFTLRSDPSSDSDGGYYLQVVCS